MDYYKDIDVLEYINDSNYMNRLNNISRYLNYAINTTIKKQVIYNIDNLEEKGAEKILFDYLSGKTESFTRENNIRKNINEIGYNNILNVLLKSAIIHKIKKEQINKEIFDEFNDDIMATTVSDYLRNDKYKDLVKLLTNDKNKMSMLISIYVNETYKLNDEERLLMDTIATQNNIANESLQILEKNANNKYNKKHS